MADNTSIEWTDTTWNWLSGCDAVSPGCKNCYAARMTLRLEAMGLDLYTGTAARNSAGKPHWTGQVNIAGVDVFLKPLRWKKPRTVFVNSMSDTFHEDVEELVVDGAFAIMALCPQHTFQVLTKRPERMCEYLTGSYRRERILSAAHCLARRYSLRPRQIEWPLPNVVLMTSVEDQKRADERIPWLLRTPAACRGLSCEPLLGPVDLNRYIQGEPFTDAYKMTFNDREFVGVDWVIVGGESQSGARPMAPSWARSLRDQCESAGVAFHFKQWGEYGPVMDPPYPMTTIGEDDWVGFGRIGKHRAGRVLDGRTHDALPVLNKGDK